MNSNILIVAAAGIGILAGAGGTYLIMPESEPVVRGALLMRRSQPLSQPIPP